ncbi:ATP-binding protein [Planktothricoides raciborskii]|uniref:histidine kinase n=1 Tax=Planktothricoides raciborskii FACHB-1370 TaxID=2949576 RepID=A0ABR8EE71_9CYAN|nr:ATP-binding protein [Planktothricoides raciborskii]MBD2544468.1 response regulator [Planktothricoides raciborskii FACHB-1370]MBD2585731.1 response regulator [Planktothricoides raciborskii FACHB-1261]
MNKKIIKIINLLLVEDNLADADLIEELLADAQLSRYKITAVERLSEAIAHLKSEPFDVILLDLSLPDSHGLETLEKVVLAAKSLPVLVLTGLTDRELAVQAVREGAQDYLVKGKFDCDLLSRAISYAVERKQTLEELRRSEERYHKLASELDLQVQERTAQLQKSLEVEAMLKRITDKVRDSLDPNQIIETAVRELAQVIGVNLTQVSLYDPKSQTFKISYQATGQASGKNQNFSAYVPEKAELYRQFFPLNFQSMPQLYQQLMKGECFQFSEITEYPNQESETILACPLQNVLTNKKNSEKRENQPNISTKNSLNQQDERVILGYLWLRNDADYEFKDLEVRLVQQVAAQCAIALRQAQLYQASLTQVKELERLHQLKDDFLSTVCHELRTPMANIKMALDMLDMFTSQQNSLALSGSITGNSLNREERSSTLTNINTASASEKITAYLQMAQVECDREIKLINDLLDLQRLDAEIDTLDGIPIQLQNWLPHVIEVFQYRIAKSEHILEVAIDPELPPLVTDPTALGRIISEMLNNACKYTPANPGEVIRLSATCRQNNQQNKFYLSVSNSGVEIPESELVHIFEKFYRIPSPDPWKQGGTGLGLALVKKLVSYLGGSISVHSGNGQTTFTLEFSQHDQCGE